MNFLPARISVDSPIAAELEMLDRLRARYPRLDSTIIEKAVLQFRWDESAIEAELRRQSSQADRNFI